MIKVSSQSLLKKGSVILNILSLFGIGLVLLPAMVILYVINLALLAMFAPLILLGLALSRVIPMSSRSVPNTTGNNIIPLRPNGSLKTSSCRKLDERILNGRRPAND